MGQVINCNKCNVDKALHDFPIRADSKKVCLRVECRGIIDASGM